MTYLIHKNTAPTWKVAFHKCILNFRNQVTLVLKMRLNILHLNPSHHHSIQKKALQHCKTACSTICIQKLVNSSNNWSDAFKDPCRTPTIFPSTVYSLLTTPESNLMASVMSVRTWSNECAVFLLSRTRTALRGFTPLRMIVTSLGLMKSLLSLPSGHTDLAVPREEGSRVVLALTDQLGFTFFV